MAFITTRVKKLTGQDNKLIVKRNPGELVFWHDAWTNEIGIGLVIGRDANYNVKPLYNNSGINMYYPSWLYIFVCNSDKILVKKIPPEWTYEIKEYDSLEDFKIKLLNKIKKSINY